ncbi:MAG: NapC/NirT family cytochrome c [Kofleriaceae bacterium]
MASWIFHNPLIAFAVACALASLGILAWFLVRRPALKHATKLALLFGIGVLPLGTAATGNVQGYLATKSRGFCGSCHVMVPYAQDSEDLRSESLAARHARAPSFGADNCYTCHADYGMYGTVTTKIGGMRHVYEYLLNFRSLTLEEALPNIHLRGRFKNSNCMQCHTTQGPLWLQIGDHASTLEQLRSGEVSCASEGCHGPAHPFSKPYHRKAKRNGKDASAHGATPGPADRSEAP